MIVRERSSKSRNFTRNAGVSKTLGAFPSAFEGISLLGRYLTSDRNPTGVPSPSCAAYSCVTALQGCELTEEPPLKPQSQQKAGILHNPPCLPLPRQPPPAPAQEPLTRRAPRAAPGLRSLSALGSIGGAAPRPPRSAMSVGEGRVGGSAGRACAAGV